MMGLSLVAVPVLIDTSTQSSHLLAQFVQMYDYGHKLMPSLAVVTFLLHGYTAVQQRASGRPWLRHVAAGVVTLLIVPFTWVAMMPTNENLFLLNAASKSPSEMVDLSLVQSLLVRWSRLHIIRSLFPLAGAIVGGGSIWKDFGQ